VHSNLYHYKILEVVSVYDADSLTVQVSLGRHLRDRWTLRLARINAPEMRDPDPEVRVKAYAARDYLRGRLEAAMSTGSEVIIHSVKLEKYGRSLAELYIDDVNINDELLEMGLAVIYGG